MKTNVLMFVAILFVNMVAFAKNDDRIALKTRQMVENATPDDWKTLADAAKICITKKSNLAQAAEWLDKSLAIKATAYNLELKGDYMALSNQPEEATGFFIKAMKAGLAQEPGFDVKSLQVKINALKK